MPETPIAFENVEVLRTTTFGFWCRIGAREVFVGEQVALPGTTVLPRAGNTGTLIVPRWFAEEQIVRRPPIAIVKPPEKRKRARRR